MRIFLSLTVAVLIASFHQVSSGQTRDPSSTPTPRPLPSFQNIIDEAKRGAVRPGEPDSRRSRNNRAEAWRQAKADMEPEDGVAAEFATLRKRLDAKLIRLHPDFDCESKLILSVEENCSGRALGASRFEALHYNNGNLTGDAFFSIVMIADLGVTDFAAVDTQNGTVKLMTGVPLPTNFSETRTLYEQLTKRGISSGGLHVGDRIEALEGKSLVVRIVEYRATGFDIFLQRPGRPPAPFEFFALERPGRHDKTFAAKVVKRSEDGVIHLLWREIAKKKPPTIRFARGEVPTDFRTKGK